MKNKTILYAMNDIQDQFIEEAAPSQRKRAGTRSVWMRMASIAACLCVLLGGVLLTKHLMPSRGNPLPNPAELSNPLLGVATVEEMERYLDFPVIVLEKEVWAFRVYSIDGRATIGEIVYADDSTFRMKYGTDDVSGIFGGEVVETKEISSVEVTFHQFEETSYATWTIDNYSFSYSVENGTPNQEVEALIEAWKTR